MADIKIGNEADDILEAVAQGGGNDKEISKFNVGSHYNVKVIGPKDYFTYYNYGLYPKVNSFIAKNPSEKSAKGYPVRNLTPWDKAWKYHADKSEKFQDHHSQEAYKYKPELRCIMGFYDLDEGKRIVIDVSKKQANTLKTMIDKKANKLNKTAFELEKNDGGAVSLTPMDMEDDITDKQKQNFDNAPEEFHIEEFTGVLYEADENEMITSLVTAGFDISLIGLEMPKQESEEGNGADADGDANDEAEPINANDGNVDSHQTGEPIGEEVEF